MKRKYIFFSGVILIFIAIFILKNDLIKAITPFFIGGIFYYILRPCVTFISNILEKHFKKISHFTCLRISIFIIGLIILILFFVLLKFVIPIIFSQIMNLLNSIQSITINIQIFFEIIIKYIKQLGITFSFTSSITNAFLYLSEKIIGYLNEIANQVPLIIENVFSIFSNILAGILISYYLLIDSYTIKNKFLNLFCAKSRIKISKKLSKIDKIISTFLQGQLLISLIIGSLEAIGLMLIGVNNALILGLIGGLSNTIPYIGPIIGAIPSIIIGIIYSPDKILLIIILFIVVQQIDNAIITPKIVEHKLGISPLLSLFVILLASELFGLIGMILAVPTTAIIKSALE